MKKKNLFTLSMLMFGFFISNAQNTKNGDVIIGLGFGFGNNYSSGSAYSTTFPPMAASFEVIVKDDLFNDGKGALGIGGQMGYVGYKYYYEGLGGSYYFDLGLGNGIGQFTDIPSKQTVVTSSSKNQWEYSNFIIGPRGYFHYSFLDKLDTYTGILLGVNFASAKGGWLDKPIVKDSSASFAWSWFVGGRYYFTDNLAAMLELGYGITYGNVGIAYKFGK